jgi:hypothetical protein
VQESKIWLTVLFEDRSPKWPPSLKDCKIMINSADTLQECDFSLPFRTSPIFPLHTDYIYPNFESCFLYFYCFHPAYPVLGRIKNIGSENLIKRVFYTIGLASILLISEEPDYNTELLKIVDKKPSSIEVWTVKKANIEKVFCGLNVKKNYNSELLKVHNYTKLPITIKAIVDEFVANIALIVPKVSIHIPNEIETFERLVYHVNELIAELIYLYDPKGAPSVTLNEYSAEVLKKDAMVRESIIHQNIDRLIQINSALSYVSTQALSGAVPILERRSLIRRHSLLGIGTSILALNSLARSIEQAFSEEPIEDIIADRMTDAKPLSGLENLPDYDPSEWKKYYSVNRWHKKVDPRQRYPKLPYYSGRLGFRETEYTISAALEAITVGLSLEWSLLTVTHEMLHGHVRNLLTLLFQGDPNKPPDEKRNEFYQRYKAQVRKEKLTDENELDSLRLIILVYCCLTITHGSITRKPFSEPFEKAAKDTDVVKKGVRKFFLPDLDNLWYEFELEYRNISEIFVHVLDLHYFYGSRIAAYIPMIWRSWGEVPHVKGDLRQYILRSLLTISTKITGSRYNRFNKSIERLRELIDIHINGILDIPLIHEVIKYLVDEEKREALFYPFSASLILVDLVENVFVSHGIRGALLGDPLVHWISEEDGFEEKFEYRLPNGFTEEAVKRPAAYLLDRLVRKLRKSSSSGNIELETAKLFLALCSYFDKEE